MAAADAKPIAGADKGLDMRAIFGPPLRHPCTQHFAEFGTLIAEVYKGREDVSTRFQEFIFGTESFTERKMNDTGSYVRGAMGTLGFDAVGWLGAAPERPPAHSQLIIRRGAAAGVSSGLVPLQQPPPGEAGPLEVPDHITGYQEGWMSAYHIHVEGETPEAGMFGSLVSAPAPETWSDLRFTAASGSHAGMMQEHFELVDAYRQCFGWLGSEQGDPVVFKQAFLDAFPHVMKAAGLYLDVDAAQVGQKQMESGNWEVSLDVPLLPSKAGERFPRLAELMQLFDPMILSFRHPKTGAVMMEWRLQDKMQHIHLYMKDGKCAWEGGDGTEGPAWWNKDEMFEVDVVAECCMVLLDLSSSASIPFPKITMRCNMDRKAGEMIIRCIEAGEPYSKVLADATMMNIDLFRRLLTQGYEWRLSNLDLGENRFAIRLFHRFIFPSESVATLVSQWFQDFVMRQLREMDALEALGLFFTAMASDAEVLSQGLPARK